MKKFFRTIFASIIYPRPFIGLFYLPKFFIHWIEFSKMNQGQKLSISDAYPNLGDWVTTTPFDPHYFYQSSWLSRNLATNMPSKHIDIGSDVKLINAISAFIPTTFIDFRPLNVELPGLTCLQGDILSLQLPDNSISSLSCLHVVEHIGLGRYGDRIDPMGSEKALAELGRVVSFGGILFLSVPVGRERICFNAHRVFATDTIIKSLPKFKVKSFSLVDDNGQYHYDCSLNASNELDYGCGMFVMEKC